MARFELRIAPSAMAEVSTISRWWRAHRQLAPRLFDRELDALFDLIELHPGLGWASALRPCRSAP